MNGKEIHDRAQVFKGSVPEILKKCRVVACVFEKEDDAVGNRTRCGRCQAASAEKYKTSGYNREKINECKKRLTATAEINEYGNEKYVNKNLDVGKGGITPDLLQDQG